MQQFLQFILLLPLTLHPPVGFGLSNTSPFFPIYHHLSPSSHFQHLKISPVYYLTFIYSSTCFGRPHAHHQELNNCSSSLWFYLRSVVIAVLLVVVGPTGETGEIDASIWLI